MSRSSAASWSRRPASRRRGSPISRRRSRITLHNPQLIADGEKAERIIEYLDPAGSLANAQAVVSAVTPAQKQRVLDILGKAK